jgi:hypothetical protein
MWFQVSEEAPLAQTYERTVFSKIHASSCLTRQAKGTAEAQFWLIHTISSVDDD